MTPEVPNDGRTTRVLASIAPTRWETTRMKKLALALMAISAALFSFGMVAEAQTRGPYGSGSGTITFTPPNPGPGQTVTITITGCTPGEVLTITITINGTPTVIGTATCVAGSSLTTGAVVGLLMPQQTGTGQATFQYTVPTAPGTYTITATGTQGYSRSVTLVIAAPAAPPAAGGLPSTGSSGINSTMTAAAALFAVGLGLFGVTMIRRRQTPTPA